jgi:hypothetical protein
LVFKKFNSNNHIGNYEISQFPVHTDKEVIDRISILCEKYLKTQDNKILDEINSISLKGFNLLVPSEDSLHNTIKKVNLNEFDEKNFLNK